MMAEKDPEHSILQGAKILFAMPQFDDVLCVTRAEYDKDN